MPRRRRGIAILVVLFLASLLCVGRGAAAGDPMVALGNLSLVLSPDLMAQAAAAQPKAGGPLEFTLQEAIAVALKNNLDITVEGYNPRLREQDIQIEEAVFDPSFTGDISAIRRRSQSNTVPGISGATISDRRNFDYDLAFNDKLPTGATAQLKLTNDRLRSNSAVQLLNPGYTSELTLSVTQPILKNFGIDINRTRVKIATNNLGISRENLRLKVMDVITRVQNGYWDLVFSIENLVVQERSLRLARDLVALNKARVRAGVAAPVEVTQAEAQEAARVQDVIAAEKAIRDAEDQLRIILNLPGTERGWAGEIIPTDKPPFEVAPLNLEESIKAALEKRPEYQAARTDLQNKDLSLRLARNQLLPDLSLNASVGSSGLDGSFGSAYGRIAGGRFNSWSVGTMLTIPLGNRAAQAAYIQARLTLDQARTSLRNLELLITSQVREGIRRIDSAAKRVEANRSARALAEEQLRVEQRRLEAGVTTTFNVLSFQRDLATAQANEIQAITEYNKALANLEQVRGTALEKNKIDL